jgi:hypothetical protein
MLDFLRKIGSEHEKLKKRIHAFRIPLSPTGQNVMKCVYFSIPLILGYFIMDFAQQKSVENLEHLKKKSNINEIQEQNEALQKTLDSIKNKRTE